MHKKLLFVIPYLANGGAQRALSNITTHFPNEWDIDILANSDRYVSYPYKGNIISLGVDEKPRTSSVFFQFKVFLKRVRKLRRLKKEGQYAACISFLDSANVANILTGRKRCKVIVSVRNSLLQSAKQPQYKYIVNPLVKLLYHKADKIIAVSKGVEGELRNYFKLSPSKIVTIENGYDVSELKRQANSTPEVIEDDALRLNGKKVIITSGRLSEQKGQWHLIRAFSEVCRKLDNVILLIMGAGELEDYLKRLVTCYDLQGKVFFMGFVENPYKYISKADIFVMPSLYEGFPNALAEALCLGVPCIATDFQTGAREILAPELLDDTTSIRQMTLGEYGILTPVCSGKRYESQKDRLEEPERILRDAILYLFTNNEERQHYIEKSKERSRSLGINSIVREWIKVIED